MVSSKAQAPARPRGLARVAYRAPIWLYRVGLGWVLGRRFLLLEHRGRRSGLVRSAVLEVVRHDAATDTYLVASGFGERSDWFRNLLADPRARIHVGRRRADVTARWLARENARRELLDYVRRHPRAARAVARLLGLEIDGTEDALRELAEVVPIVALTVSTSSR